MAGKINVNDITITSLETITAFDITSGAFKFVLDELQNATIEQSQDTSDITGKGGRKLSTIKRNKAVTISGTNGLVSGGLLELQTGSEFENGTVTVLWTDYLTVTGNAATTSWKAVGTSGKEIKALYTRNADGTLGAKLEQAATAASGKFAYDLTKKALSFTGLEDGTEVVVYYRRKITADTLANKSDVYSGKCSLYIDALGEDKCSNIYRIQFYIPKADFSGEFSLEMGDDQVVHEFEAEALAGACGTGGMLWTYTVFGADTADIA